MILHASNTAQSHHPSQRSSNALHPYSAKPSRQSLGLPDSCRFFKWLLGTVAITTTSHSTSGSRSHPTSPSLVLHWQGRWPFFNEPKGVPGRCGCFWDSGRLSGCGLSSESAHPVRELRRINPLHGIAMDIVSGESYNLLKGFCSWRGGLILSAECGFRACVHCPIPSLW
ncbi:hypothetical protein BV25DRAFT_704567 [Artomyces pyxidatus]|uniref:Uncharacterized protein n=1 Tax=Artomyces pyxidatus TaxID=48021 RepID=A0ACB8T1C0_9AGAM|nr:hypothetical protein BV25DRAFT_704567 [Artomyces pyxidatus]